MPNGSDLRSPSSPTVLQDIARTAFTLTVKLHATKHTDTQVKKRKKRHSDDFWENVTFSFQLSYVLLSLSLPMHGIKSKHTQKVS
jgi:hypothetical protein